MIAEDLRTWIVDALLPHVGAARVPRVAQNIWENHETDLRRGGDLIYSWHYAGRWAGKVLQDDGRLTKKGEGRTWSLIS